MTHPSSPRACRRRPALHLPPWCLAAFLCLGAASLAASPAAAPGDRPGKAGDVLPASVPVIREDFNKDWRVNLEDIVIYFI
ncbi:MAG: hypothetical protein JXQ83_15215 [Candidatus Glassbacteria bacterium]|nr:hypothetical protein [Candidatus Glassbacteria bacterium]